MNRKIKVLFYTELWANAGIESVIMSLYRNFDLSSFSVDIMASQNLTDFHDNEIKELGGRKIITLKGEYKSPFKRMMANQKAFKDVISSNCYDVVHIHMCNASAMVYGKIAKENNVKVVAYHSHNTNLSTKYRFIKTAVHNLCKKRFEKYGDIYFSCSDLASKWMFNKNTVDKGKVVLVKNAIDLQRFAVNQDIRNEYRKKLNLEGKFVVGHIGRFAVAKNHQFLIDIFAEIKKIEPNSKLLLIGEGEDETAIRSKVKKLGLEDSVIFYGITREIPQMLWVMDAFVLPSFFEGNPVVGIEAQAASVRCFFADTITRMCKLTDFVSYHSLDSSASDWAKEILASKGYARNSTYEIMREAGYDIKSVAENVQMMYKKTLN